MICLKCNEAEYKNIEVSKCPKCGDVVYTHEQSLKLDAIRRAVADRIIALDKPTGVVRVDKAGKETELTQEELCEWARWLIKNGMPYRSPTGDTIPWQVGWSELRESSDSGFLATK